MFHSSRCLVYLVIIGLSATVWTGECVARPEVKELQRQIRQTCGTRSFQCASGECIDVDLKCNGIADCSDSSDESADICQEFSCSPFAFKCSYGACVDGSAECDGKRDCLDNSDESHCSPPADTGKCKREEFPCNSGECIQATLMCDGNRDCKDGSDETSATCSQFRCNPFSFRCDYGACIDADKVCDGEKQCVDGSDESSARFCPKLSGSCKLPLKPIHGWYHVFNCQDSGGCQSVPGTSVKPSTGLTFSCDEGYKIEGRYPLILCVNGQWSADIPMCVTATCDPLSSKSLDISCVVGRKKVSCDRPMEAGTEATLKCKTAYQQTIEFGYKSIRCSLNGTWDGPLFNCVPVCGKRIPEGQIQISNGTTAEVGEFPWHAAVYKTKVKGHEQICGGSLITTTLVLSAAHCFWNNSIDGINDKKLYTIAVGKYYRSYDENEKEKQERKVADIFVPEEYHDRQNYFQSDIAIVVLKVEVEFTWAVQPICIDWDHNKEREQLTTSQSGSVAGWGYTEFNKPSEKLQTAKLPYIEYNACYNRVPGTFKPFITNDKFCAGYDNGTTSVCPGDSGGGLAFENRALEVWYLQGIVSIGVSPPSGQKCTIDKYTAFTKVSRYIDWIRDFKDNYRPTLRHV